MFGRTRFFLFLLLSLALQSFFAQFAVRAQTLITEPVLAGYLENNNGQFLLHFTNNSAQELRGLARLSLGNDSGQTEAGQFALVAPPQQTRLFVLHGLRATGEQYTLRIYDQKNVLLFYKIAPVRRASYAIPATAIPVSLSGAAPVAVAPVPTPVSAAPAPPRGKAGAPAGNSEVKVRIHLVANQESGDSFVIAFDLFAARLIADAALSVTMGRSKQQKPVTINQHAVVEFKLPEELDNDQLVYALTDKDGRTLASGTTSLNKLHTDDTVVVSDIQTDKSAYNPGEAATLTMLVEGQTARGFRLEVTARDALGSVFFRDTRQGAPAEPAASQQFSFTIPKDTKAPLIFEFKIYDGESGQLLDSGERELNLNEK